MPSEDKFDSAIAKRSIKSLKADRNAITALFAECEERITTLPVELDKVFSLEEELLHAKDQIKRSRSSNEVFVQALLLEDDKIVDSDNYKSDQKGFREKIKDLENVIETTKKNFFDKGINLAGPKVEHIANEDLAALITVMKSTSEANADASQANANAIKSLVDSAEVNAKVSINNNNKVMAQLISKNQAPKMTQPKFTPSDTIQDYRHFREWLSNFELFIRDVRDHRDRLQWLRSSVKNKAFDLIEGFAIKGDNYVKALDKLKAEYLSSVHIKNAIYDTIYNWQNKNPDKLYKNVRENLISLENHLIELQDTYQIDVQESFCQGFLAHIVLRNVPAPLRNGMFDKLDKLDPTLEEIFRNAQDIIKKLNLEQDYVNTYPTKQNNNNTNKTVATISNNTNQATTSSSSFQSSGSTNRSRSSNRSGSKKSGSSKRSNSCLFCSNIGHKASFCTTYVSLDARKKQLVKLNRCTKCMRIASAGCTAGNCSKSLDCFICHMNHLKPLCPSWLSQSNAKTTTAMVTSKMTKCNKSVALPLIAASIDCNANPADKAVALLLDSGSQATLIKRNVVTRLGLPLDNEKIYASFQGYAGQSLKGTLFDTVTFRI